MWRCWAPREPPARRGGYAHVAQRRGARGFGVEPCVAAQRAGAARARCGPSHRADAQQRSASCLLLRGRPAPRGQTLRAAVVSVLLGVFWDAASSPVRDISAAQPNLRCPSFLHP